MTPRELVDYWMEGHGGYLEFGPNSEISRQFSETRGANQFEQFVYDKYHGDPQPGDRVDNFDYKFTVGRAFTERSEIMHIIGSWQDGVAVVDSSGINFSAQNTLSWNSFWAGRPLNDWFGVTPVGERPSDLDITIKWRKNLRPGR